MNKDFKDFIKTLTKDDIKDILTTDNQTISFKLDDEGLKKFSDQLQIVNFKIALNLLNEYHKWLNS